MVFISTFSVLRFSAFTAILNNWVDKSRYYQAKLFQIHIPLSQEDVLDKGLLCSGIHLNLLCLESLSPAMSIFPEMRILLYAVGS